MVPWIQGAIELDIAMIFEPASRTDVNSRFAPRTIGVGKQFTADKRRCLRGTLHKRRIVVVRDAQQRDIYQCSVAPQLSGGGSPINAHVSCEAILPHCTNVSFAAGNSKPGTTKIGRLYPLKMACDDATTLIRGSIFRNPVFC